MKRSPKIGRWAYKNFEIISWFFTIILILSIIQVGISAYNFVAYGNCNGKDSDEFCIFDPFGTGTNGHALNDTASCSVAGVRPDFPLLRPEISNSPYIGNIDSNVVIVEFGCYSCGYTIQAEPTMIKLRQDYSDKYLFVFKHFPIPTHNYSYESAIAAECARMQDSFWEYHEKLFAQQGKLNDSVFVDIANDIGLDTNKFIQCYENQETKSIVDADIEEGKRIGIYGTPTVFVNDDYLVGPKDYSEYKRLIRKND